MTKPKPACSKSAKPSCYNPSVPESCSTVPLPEVPKSAPDLKYSDYVMALHGRFIPHTHSKIFGIANELGIRYEHFPQHIAECTHLITTESEVNAPCLSFKLKIAALKNCKIVNINWLFKSLAQGHPVSVSGFELRSIELDKLKKKGLDNMKRAWEEENGKEIPSAKVPKVKLRAHGFFTELVDDAFPGPEKGLIVWTHAKIVYDATMFKLVRKESSPKPVVTFRRQQILHDPHMNEYHTWSYEKVDDVITEGNRAGLGDLKSAKRAFEKLFQDTTGNTWDERHKKSTSSKFTFVECHFNDEWLNLQNLNPEGTASKVNEVFDLITTHIGGRKALVKKLLPSKCMTHTEDSLTLAKHELRLCLAILKQLLVYSDYTKKKAERSTLIECYRALVESPKLNTSVDLESVKDEYEHLSYHRIISLAPQQELDYPGWTEAHLAQHIHRAVGLRTMRLGKSSLFDPSTTEHNQLSNYFRFSTESSAYYPGGRYSYRLINIFRIERLQEVQQYEKWIEKHDGRRRLLWHGSPNANFSGIFSQGLRGGMRESGIFASELAGISTAYSMKNGGGALLMLLCEVSIAKRSDPSRAKYRDAKCIHPDLEGVQMLDIAVGESHNFARPTMAIPHEHRMPSADQVRMRYLFHFKC